MNLDGRVVPLYSKKPVLMCCVTEGTNCDILGITTMGDLFSLNLESRKLKENAVLPFLNAEILTVLIIAL